MRPLEYEEVELTELENVHGGMKWGDFPTSNNVEYAPGYVPDDGVGVLDGDGAGGIPSNEVGPYDFGNNFDYQDTGQGYDAYAVEDGAGGMGGDF